MSITNDIRSYADTALEQGKQVLDQAQSQLNDVTSQANEFVGKLRGTATDNVSTITSKANGYVVDLRTQAEKAVNLEAIKAAIEPYVAQAKGYSTTVTDRAEELYSTVKSDKRVAKLVSKAEEITGTVVETVQDRLVKPVQSLTGLGIKPAAPKAAAPKPAVTRPAAKKAPAKKAPAKRAVKA
ncbi:MAG: hypothetical protein QOG80_1723 [Pseudonocardiales bacterium]|jgi:F0F1-type ATP synthase membrane subunit b/b'|nr:hypothetical protein [Pseudonocardiales bacterium]